MKLFAHFRSNCMIHHPFISNPSLFPLPWNIVPASGALALLAVGLGLLFRWGVVQARRLSLSRGELKLPGWPKEAGGLRVLHLTDLHFRPHSDLGDRVLHLAAQAQPDLVLITGDLLFPGEQGQAEALEFLREIASGRPTFLVPGNKDYLKGKRPPCEQWATTGAEVLCNRAVSLHHKEQRFWIAGVEDPHSGRDDLAAALDQIPPGEPIILLAHSPEIVLRDGMERAAIIFAGHTHGGQICLPGGKALYTHTTAPRRYASGVHAVGDGKTWLVVSRGVGVTRLPLRLWCPPEMTVWTLAAD